MTDYNAEFHLITSDSGLSAGTDGYLNNITSYQFTPEPHMAFIPEGLGSGIQLFYKMRALRNPLGTGFVSWTVMFNPDPNGDQAPVAIVPGSAVIMASWIG